jgi:hypothetical protein
MSWLISQALMNSHFSQEQGVASLAENFSDGEQSAPLNGNPIQQAYCAPDKMTDFSRLSRFGMTYKPLTENRGQELLTLYLAGFHAKTLAPQEKVTDLTESEAGCGDTWHAWLAKYDPDTCSWKTPQCSLLEEEPELLATLPKWGMTVNGLLWELQTLEPITNETECGLSENWPTPRSCSAMAATITPESAWNQKRNPNLETIVGKRLWPTPTAHMAKETNAPSEHNRNTPTLTAQVNWPTPRTKGMCGGSGAWDLLNKNTTVEEARQMGAGNGGKLNPTWVEWLMGWPLGWTDLKPLETDKSQCVPQQLGDC